MRKVFVLLVSIVAAKAVASPEIRECSMNSMLDKVTSTLAQYAKDVATERRIDFLPESVQVKYLGVRDIVDNKQMPARKQNTFSIEFKTNRGSTMAFMTPAQGLCENKPDFCYYPDNGVVVALPNPEIVEKRDSEGILVSRTCVLRSHGGINRYILLLNMTEQVMVYDELISSRRFVITYSSMPLK